MTAATSTVIRLEDLATKILLLRSRTRKIDRAGLAKIEPERVRELLARSGRVVATLAITQHLTPSNA